MTDEPAEDAPLPARPEWNALLAMTVAAAAAMFAGLALAVSMGAGTPQVAAAAHAATPAQDGPSPGRAVTADRAAWPLVAIELLLPHVPRPEPYPRAFAVAVALAAADTEATRLLLPLAAAAAEGAPTRADLVAGFAAAAEAATLAEIGFTPDAGWIARRVAATARFGAGLGAAGTPGLAALRDAAGLLEAGALADAAQALDALPAESAAALSPWRAGLDRRIAADLAHGRLSDLALRRAHEAAR
ncbi:hypothetical protein [Roseomonas sp. HF4]|uniref:hypothetical protein n=1 Tax=Roseomonas sp. HF4 TaxID=2562313 RepID=UPI0010C12B45|nr:hypothetical protein [Roseomonas sp. HF4]